MNADGRPDLFVAGYADTNAPVPGSAESFPSNVAAVRDRLYLNVGPDWKGRSQFREAASEAGIEAAAVDHGLGSAFTDVNGDGRIDLYVANDLDPNRLYVNVPASNDLGFRFEERGAEAGVADRNAGMGVAAADYSGDGRPDLFVTNAHNQLHGVFESRSGKRFADARPEFASVFDTTLAGWGASWADLDQDGALDLAIANGAIPVTNLKMDAEPIKVLGALDEGYEDVSRASASGRRASTGEASPWPTTTTTATSTSRSRRSLADSSCSGAPGRTATGSRCSSGPRGGGRRHRRPPRRAPARPRGQGRDELPLLRGPARPLRPRRRDHRSRAARPLPERPRNAAHRRAGRPPRHHREVARAKLSRPRSVLIHETGWRHERDRIGVAGPAGPQSAGAVESLLERIRTSVVGDDAVLEGPFGLRRLVYASGASAALAP